jgi:hypothetical protein
MEQASSQDLDCYAELMTASALNGLRRHRSLRDKQCHAEIGGMPPKRQKFENIFGQTRNRQWREILRRAAAELGKRAPS